jgi:hypothetical protein
MIYYIKEIYRHTFSEKARILIHLYWDCILYQPIQTARYKKTLLKLRRKGKIKVAFFMETNAMWKLDRLYWLMEKSDKFEPIVIICPWITYRNDHMYDLLNQVDLFCKKKQYNYVNTYDERSKTWKDIKKLINPDIVFFVQPYSNSIKEYNFRKFLKTSLTCYVSYIFFIIANQQKQFNLLFHNIIWRGFCETPIHKMMSEKYAYNKGKNIRAFGFPLFDEFTDKKLSNQIKDVWKIKNKSIKRIIWAPHHRIVDGSYNAKGYNSRQFSCFLSYAFLMLDIAEKYKDKIQIAFKPHPRLKSNLYTNNDWGIKKTDEYYKKWEDIKNGQLEEGDYIDLFLTSDAMILDSISFICEYLYTNNPILYTMGNRDTKHDFNEFGEMAFQQIYHSYSQEDIENFINNVLMAGEDIMQNDRKQFFDTYLLPPNNVSASQNIFNYLLTQLS